MLVTKYKINNILNIANPLPISFTVITNFPSKMFFIINGINKLKNWISKDIKTTPNSLYLLFLKQLTNLELSFIELRFFSLLSVIYKA